MSAASRLMNWVFGGEDWREPRSPDRPETSEEAPRKSLVDLKHWQWAIVLLWAIWAAASSANASTGLVPMALGFGGALVGAYFAVVVLRWFYAGIRTRVPV